jgi:prepilin-type N-terminal cleavage/methylation domain-containing protein
MKQRKGFTLIELMIVIAIIIILAAIAIPNYLRMTDRARRSRVAGDFTSLATACEAYQVDWGHYPKIITASAFGKGIDGNATNGMVSTIAIEITGTKGTTFPNTDNTFTNYSGATTLTGENGGIEYIKAGTIAAMYNPFNPTRDGTNNTDCYFYVSDSGGTHWALYVYLTSDTSKGLLYRSDTTTDLKQVTTAPTKDALNP